jgi:hypothetical protein
MALSEKNKRLMLGGALLLTLALSAWLGMDKPEDGADVVEATKSPVAKSTASKRVAAPLRVEPALPVLAKVRATDESEPQGDDIFKSRNWYVAPPPSGHGQAVAIAPAAPIPEQAPPAPVPPPLPFTYLGTVQENGRTVFFLAKEQRLYTVRKGEVFDGRQYRLEDAGQGRIEFIYLPLNAKQTLAIKGAS